MKESDSQNTESGDKGNGQGSGGVTLEPPAPVVRPRRKGKRLVKPEDKRREQLTPEQRLLVLDIWQRSGLSAKDMAPLIGVSKHTLYAWNRRFKKHGPAGLMDGQRGARPGSKLPVVTKRSILMLKKDHPEYGCQRISDELARGPGLGASAGAVGRVLKEAGFVLEDIQTKPHKPKVQRFERARPGELWQTDLFTFTLKRMNRRVYLMGFMDDHSRFIVSWGLHGSSTTDQAIEVLRAGIASWGPPKELLTDNGPQYTTWRGKSRFTKELERQQIRQIIARPKHPQTLGKIERFWGSLWRETLERSIFNSLDEARERIGHYVDHYNFHRPHQGIDGLVPADRFFDSAPEVKKQLASRVAENALELACHGTPQEPFYLTGTVGGKRVSVHADSEHVYVSEAGEKKREVALSQPADDVDLEPRDQALAKLKAQLLPADPLEPVDSDADAEPEVDHE